MIECDGRDDEEETRACVARLGLGLEEVRRRIADTMGGVLEHLMDLGLESTLLVTGGDTLLAFMRRIQQGQLTPICELTPGVALSQIQYRGKTYNLMSKSGGFGGETLIADLEQLIVHHSKEELVC